MEIYTFDKAHDTLCALTQRLREQIAVKRGKEPFFLALSGGETAQAMFRMWASQYRTRIEWERVRFFWVDERCVPPDDPESNYGYAAKLLFPELDIPDSHIFRIRGEDDPEREAVRYGSQAARMMPVQRGFPVFDAAIMGIGKDGHTASIFPQGMRRLLDEKRGYDVSAQPETGQLRVTMTGGTILHARSLLWAVLGGGKAAALRKALPNVEGHNDYPAGYFFDRAPQAVLYTDSI